MEDKVVTSACLGSSCKVTFGLVAAVGVVKVGSGGADSSNTKPVEEKG